MWLFLFVWVGLFDGDGFVQGWKSMFSARVGTIEHQKVVLFSKQKGQKKKSKVRVVYEVSLDLVSIIAFKYY